MAEKWKPNSLEVLRSWADAIIDEASDELTDWENKFIIDIEVRLARGSTLTQSQEEKLEQIYTEKTK